MRKYVVQRLLLMVPTVLFVSMVIFSLIRLIPGDVTQIMVENFKYADDTKELKRQLGLDQPIPVQYARWLWGVVRGDFGTSIWTKRSIGDELKTRFPVSLELGLYAMLVSVALAIPVGVLAAIRQDTWIDYVLRTFSIIFLSVPGFWLATLVVVLPSLWWQKSPLLPWAYFHEDPLRNLLVLTTPALILGVDRAAALMRMTRSQMLEVLRQDYVRTAWAKGLRERRVVLRHALKNALIPVVTIVGLQVPVILGGSLIMESIFNLPGMGQFLINVINQRDYPMLQAITVVFTVTVLAVNLVVDIIYAYLDPRVRLG
jgi:peptide/nickel transport system permease protein